MKPEPTLENRIIEATNEVAKYMISKITMSKAETDIQVAKKKNHFLLQKAKERLSDLESELLK
jgi:hypothetical protein